MHPTLSSGVSAYRMEIVRAPGKWLPRLALPIAAGLAILFLGLVASPRAHAEDIGCSDVLSQQSLRKPDPGRIPEDTQPNLVVSSTCVVKFGTYYFGQVNIIKGGKLIFKEEPSSTPSDGKKIIFWAKSILIENGGTVEAGVDGAKPFGEDGGSLDIILYGEDQTKGQPGVEGKGALCVSPPYVRGYQSTGGPVPDCGIPKKIWETNGAEPVSLLNDAPGGDNPDNVVKDNFYQYGTMMMDSGLTDGRVGHFGYKVLGLSYGGTLDLRGYEGTIGSNAADPTDSGTSWVRLAEDAPVGATELTLSRSVEGSWKKGDKIVVTTTDYVPDHSEEVTLTADPKGNKVSITPALNWPHNGHMFDVAKLLGENGKAMTKGMDPSLQEHAETRAAVALLSRSIVIESGGDRAGETFKDATVGNADKGVPADPNYAMGATTVFRQGFMALHIDGVEFANMGVGGRMGHYPVHFHKARNVPNFADNRTYVRDSSVDVSMTRWFVLHDTNNVELSRNVGWKSIGHGYYLEDGTESNNKFFSNIGILARAGVVGADNPRNIPGILAQNGNFQTQTPDRDPAMYRSDILHPSVFWITNGWNELVGNMAVGAGACGTCFWFVPVTNTDAMDVPPSGVVAGTPTPETWTGYSAEQARGTPAGPGSTPVKFFYKNYCSTAMQAVNFVGSTSECNAVGSLNRPPNVPSDGRIEPIRNPLAPQPDMSDPVTPMKRLKMYYPDLTGVRLPTICDPSVPNSNANSCMKVARCSSLNPSTCGTTVVDHFTTSFNWSETNFAAIWMRGAWNMVDNSFISDVQNGGLTIVSGGDYSRSSAPLGYWGLVSHTVFAGYTQPQDKDNLYALEQGPCAALKCSNNLANTRIDLKSSIGFPMSNWATYQRLFSIYDGPVSQDANAYLNIKAVDCDDAATCMYWGVPGVRRYPGTDKGYLPNAAIGWKQPNGFYYPPAFTSRDLFFNNVDIRHFVVTPIMVSGTYRTDTATAQKQLVGIDPKQAGLYAGYTDIDRQTVLNDEDGSLTGFKNTISVNDDISTIDKGAITKEPGGFFEGPVQAEECESSVGVNPTNACAGDVPKTPPSTRTSPYDYITTIVYPACATSNNNGNGINAGACGSATGDAPFDTQPGFRFKELAGRGGMWSRDCAGPFCTGVKLYRQDLTVGSASYPREWQRWQKDGCTNPATAATSAKCNFPFIRMAGANEWQRNTLTANSGVYYLDTTVSQKTQRETPDLGLPDDPTASYVECDQRTVQPTPQKPVNCQPRSVSVFQAGQTYDVLFLFAKSTTKQVYQIYVGEGFDPEKDVKGIRVTSADIAFTTADWPLPTSWAKSMEMISSDPSGKGPKDVLQITVDFSDSAIPELNPKKLPAGQICQPASFCTGSGASCHCALDVTKEPWLKLSPTLLTSCESACKSWAVNDLDYPSIGILGFSFTLPSGFEAKDQYKRPQPIPAETTTPTSPWNVMFKPAKETLAGSCFHQANQIPGQAGCGVPN